MMLVGVNSLSIVSAKLQMLAGRCSSSTPNIPARHVADAVKFARKSSPNGGTRATVERNLTAITMPLLTFLPSDGGFRWRKLPEKPPALAVGSHHPSLRPVAAIR